MRNFVKIDAQEGCLRVHALILYGVLRRRRIIRMKSSNFQVPITQKLRGRFLSNLVCNVVYMVRLKYVNLKEIHPIVFKLQ